MAEASDGSDLPAHSSDTIVLYAIGPGYGESLVLLLPDGKVVVVDGCGEGASNHTKALLERLRIRSIDLLVISHPDDDHVRGVAELIDSFSPSQLWLYPAADSLRSLSAAVLNSGAAGSARLIALRELDRRVERLSEQRRVKEIVSDKACFAFAHGELTCLPPTFADQRHARKRITKLIELTARGSRLAQPVRDYFDGKPGGRLSDHPNTLSLALSVRWRQRRLLLAGDLEYLGSDPKRGWMGQLWQLTELGKIDLMRAIDLVKVAHHGSDNAFCEDAWRLHREAVDETVGLICPFNKSGELPAQATLAGLKRHCARLGLTTHSATIDARLQTTDWSTVSAITRLTTDIPLIAAVLPKVGPVQLMASPDATVRR